MIRLLRYLNLLCGQRRIRMLEAKGDWLTPEEAKELIDRRRPYRDWVRVNHKRFTVKTGEEQPTIPDPTPWELANCPKAKPVRGLSSSVAFTAENSVERPRVRSSDEFSGRVRQSGVTTCVN